MNPIPKLPELENLAADPLGEASQAAMIRSLAAEAGHLYRETFLDLVLPPSQASAWRRVGEDTYQGLLAVSGNRPEVPGVTLLPGLLAVAADAEYLARLAAFLGSGSDLEPTEEPLYVLAQQASHQLKLLALLLRREVTAHAESPA